MNAITLGEENLTLEQITEVSKGAQIDLSTGLGFRSRVQASRIFLDNKINSGEKVYGVSTGFGDSVTVDVEKDLLHQLPINITRFHSCGMGDVFKIPEVRAIQASRIASLVSGYSGVSLELLEFMVMQLNQGIYPRIPKEGSVGASGDLTPLAYLASTIIGEGQCFYKGELHHTKKLYDSLKIKPYLFKPKEGLAIMNGTAVMTALACMAYERAERLTHLCCINTSIQVLALLGNPSHYDEELFLAKPHEGQLSAARQIASALTDYLPDKRFLRLQDRYSLRCAPHIIGVLRDALPMFRRIIEVELNSANDNPLIVADKELVLHGGNFYGGHIAFVMDSMKNLVANLADLMDRQLALIVDPKFNNGLPAGLSGAKGKIKTVNHGFKAVQIAASAWTAEALKNTMPASVFSRSTECHNQDKVSMGTIAARDCIRVLELTEQVAAAVTLGSVQALELRTESGELSQLAWGENISRFVTGIRSFSEKIIEDRGLEEDLRDFLEKLNSGNLV